MLDFTAIDFETANSYRGSPCAVGLVRVRDGRPVDERHWLMRPPELVDHFDAFNTWVHGITEQKVADAPRWLDVLPAIAEFIGDDVVVAHNAGFDIGVIRYACAVDNVEWPAIRFLCTMVLARRVLSLPSYRLPFVVGAIGGVLNDHHDALADAQAVVAVVVGLAAAAGASDLAELAASAGVGIGRMSSGIYKGSVAISRGGAAALAPPEVNPDADRDGYLYARIVVFTGALMSMTRQIAWEECARIGAIAEPDVTKRTNVLVVGDINPAVLRPGSEVTGKARRAFELQDKGQDIEVMTEDDFVRCIEGKPLDGLTVLLAADTQSVDDARATIPSYLRAIPLSERPALTPSKAAKPPSKPRALRRIPAATDQTCSVEGCDAAAAFRTRTKPTWCAEHIMDLQHLGGLRPLEPFSHPDDWQLTECLVCAVHAHYRFDYILEKNRWNERTCRACYWRQWAANARAAQGNYADIQPVAYDSARSVAEENGFDYLGPLTAPSLSGDPHHTRCRRCSKVSAERLADIAFGCSCRPHPR